MKNPKLLKFNDNEGAARADLNSMQDALTARAWEWPGFADLLAAYPFSGTTYDDCFETPGNAFVDKMAFVKGAGCRPYNSGLVFDLKSGFLGLRISTLPVKEFDLTVPETQMAWFAVAGGDVAKDLTTHLAAAGQHRYILITAATVDGTGDAESRNIKDAVTGVVSSSSMDKRSNRTIVFDVQPGTSGASPIVPALSGSVALIAIVIVSDSAIVSIWDATVPFGPLQIHSPPPALFAPMASHYAADPRGFLHNDNVGGEYVWVPCPLAGDPTARVIGIQVQHKLSTGATMHLYMAPFDGGGTTDVVSQFTEGTDFTADGTQRTATLLFLSEAITGAGVGLRPPVWAHGANVKDYAAAFPANALVLKIQSGTGASRDIHAVKWFIAKG